MLVIANDVKRTKKRGVHSGGRKGTRKASPARVKSLKAKGFTAEEIATALGISRRSAFNYLKEWGGMLMSPWAA